MRFLLSLLMFAALTWSVALAWFVNAMPSNPLPSGVRSEALVVLTGGQGRVEHGFEMLAANAAPLLFISGVGEHVTQEEMLIEHADAEVKQQIEAQGSEIVLDHIARSTVSNADQSATFLKAREIKTIRLITANYHMKRSIHEFHAAYPTLRIIPDPVFPSGFRRHEWWEHENTRRLVFSEFYKYFAVVIRDLLRAEA
jgi:uncharacterized SAM-binding protein YcdF (DUF218 family)